MLLKEKIHTELELFFFFTLYILLDLDIEVFSYWPAHMAQLVECLTASLKVRGISSLRSETQLHFTLHFTLLGINCLLVSQPVAFLVLQMNNLRHNKMHNYTYLGMLVSRTDHCNILVTDTKML